MDESFQPYEPTRTPVPARSAAVAAAPGELIGTAHHVQLRTEGGGQDSPLQTVLTFRLQVADRDRPIEVEMRSFGMSGSIADGDQVAVPGKIARSGRIETLRVKNLTSGTVVGWQPANRAARIAFIIFFILIVLFILFVAGNILFGFSTYDTGVEIGIPE